MEMPGFAGGASGACATGVVVCCAKAAMGDASFAATPPKRTTAIRPKSRRFISLITVSPCLLDHETGGFRTGLGQRGALGQCTETGNQVSGSQGRGNLDRSGGGRG